MKKTAKKLTDFSVAAILNLNTTKDNSKNPTNKRVLQNDDIDTDDGNETIEKKHENVESSPDRRKKSRTVFTRQQIQRLEHAFDRKKYFTNAERQKLATDLALSETQVKIWLQNRRNKWKKQLNNVETSKQLISYHNLLLAEKQVDLHTTTLKPSADNYLSYDRPPTNKLLL